jgi:hypothetical protein
LRKLGRGSRALTPMENQDAAYGKSENSERIRLIFELDRDIDVTMLCTKFEGCEAIISGVIV